MHTNSRGKYTRFDPHSRLLDRGFPSHERGSTTRICTYIPEGESHVNETDILLSEQHQASFFILWSTQTYDTVSITVYNTTRHIVGWASHGTADEGRSDSGKFGESQGMQAGWVPSYKMQATIISINYRTERKTLDPIPQFVSHGSCQLGMNITLHESPRPCGGIHWSLSSIWMLRYVYCWYLSWHPKELICALVPAVMVDCFRDAHGIQCSHRINNKLLIERHSTTWSCREARGYFCTVICI